MKQEIAPVGASQDSLQQRFEQQALRWPDRIALSYRDQQLSYQQLNKRADEQAQKLRADGIQAGDLVALMLPRGLDLVVQVLAILKASAGYVPIDPNYPSERVNWMIGSSRPAQLLTQQNLCEQLWGTSVPAALHNRIRYVTVDEAAQETGLPEPSNPTPVVNKDHALAIAYIIFTSGSTGKPKGVAVGQQQVLALLDAVIPTLGADRSDVWTLFHSLAFDFSVWELWGALTTGGRLCIVPQDVAWSPDAFSRLLRQEQVTILNQTPSAFYALTQAELRLRAEGAAALPLRSVIFGGEALNVHQLKRWWSCYPIGQPRLINMYGITETCVHVTWLELTQALAELDGSPIGAAIPGLQVHLLDQALNPVAEGEPGELYVGGRQLALGYLGRPDLTASRFIADPTQPGQRLYRSGDLAVKRAGQLFYLGRADRQLKVRGFRIEPAEVEAAIETHSAIARCAVLALPADETQSAAGLIAFLVAQNALAPLPDATALRQHLAARLPVHSIPAEFVWVAVLPLTMNGKLDQTALVQQWQSPPPNNLSQQNNSRQQNNSAPHQALRQQQELQQEQRLKLLRARLADTSQ